jgi:hypothetical protein
MRGEVIDRFELGFVLQMKQHFVEAVNLTNETNEEAQRDEQEMEDNGTEEEGSNENESDPENESHGAFQELVDSQFRRDLGQQLERDFGSFLFTMARREVICQARPAGNDPIEILNGFRRWWFVDLELSHKVDPDKPWREVHRCEPCERVAHIPLGFVTVGTSKAEVERALSAQSHIPGIHGTD